MPMLRAYKWKLLLLSGLMLLSVALALVQVNFIQQSVDVVLSRNTTMLLRILVLFIALTAIRLLHIYIYGQCHANVYINMEKDLKNKFVNKILKTKMKEMDKENSGDLSTKCNSDIANALDFIKNSFSAFFTSPIMAVSAFIYLLWFNWQLSLIVFIPLPILAIMLNIMSSRASKFWNKMQGLNSDYTAHIYDVIQGAETVRTYNMQQIKMKQICKTIGKIARKHNKYYISEAVTLALIMAVTYVPTVVAFIYGAYLVRAGEIDVSLLFGYAQLIGTVSGPFIGLFSTMVSIKNSYHSMKRIDTVMHLEEESVNSNLLNVTGDAAIKFRNVKFGYESNTSVFQNLNFTIEKGKCVGIVGGSGAGKSTILQLLSGLYEVEAGEIEIFGQALQSLSVENLRSNISYVSQQTHILPDTIYENVKYGNLNATDDEILRAIELAGLKTYIGTLPDGVHTVLAENGSNLSGGQRQRVSLARAFLRKSPLYIFDEPTASLDPDIERQIVRTINEVVAQHDITSIIISHNVNAIQNCDEVYHLRNGKLLAWEGGHA